MRGNISASVEKSVETRLTRTGSVAQRLVIPIFTNPRHWGSSSTATTGPVLDVVAQVIY